MQAHTCLHRQTIHAPAPNNGLCECRQLLGVEKAHSSPPQRPSAFLHASLGEEEVGLV